MLLSVVFSTVLLLRVLFLSLCGLFRFFSLLLSLLHFPMQKREKIEWRRVEEEMSPVMAER